MTNDIQITRRCPSCGREVVLSPGYLPGFEEFDPYDPLARGPESDPPGIRRIVHALCGCYIFDMPDPALGRLLTSVLAMDEDDFDEQGSGGMGAGGSGVDAGS